MSTAQSEVQEKPAGITLGELVAAPDYKANLGFVHEVVEDLKRVFELIPKEHLPVVIFIDDLDRCSPGKVAAVVEAINLFLAGEFPDCMFVLGIDDEMVAAALDEAHCNVIARLPGYARATSIGWRFMDKFVQLPFIVPPSSEEELSRYMDSLLSERQDSKSIDMELHDRAARIVEQNGATEQSSLSGEQQEALKQHIEITREMDQNIREFTDQEQSIRELISAHAKKHFANPRDLKRFVNLFRFYYFLRAARAARREMIPSLDQMSRWIALSLKWPEVVRWLRQQGATQDDSTNLALRTLERLGSVTHQTLEGWQKGARDQLGLQVDQTPWLSDEGLMRFFQNEASLAPEQQPLSACGRMGLW